MESVTIKKQDAKNKILGYYRNHQYRMLYKTFKEKGVLIGSESIESAHSNVIQKRLDSYREKQSGQR